MVRAKHGCGPCKTSSSNNPQNHGCQLLWAPTSPKVVVCSGYVFAFQASFLFSSICFSDFSDFIFNF